MTTALGEREIERQKVSNRNALGHYESFAGHRRRLTELLEARARAFPAERPRLCVLGAGNCGDLDLARLAASYRSIHLVDIDEIAVTGAVQRESELTRTQLVARVPIDLSGLLASLDRWRHWYVTADELLAHPSHTAARIAQQLGERFEVVVSACVLSQLHFSVRNALSELHPLFDAVNFTLTLTHLRTLARLTEPGGSCLLMSDIATEEMAPLAAADESSDLRALLAQQMLSGAVFDTVRPDKIAAISHDDPTLRRELGAATLADVWIWHNGPRRRFLVYALEMERLGATASPATSR
jgi:hypothetical protein